MPSVLGQDWPGQIEHVIVSDENPVLRDLFGRLAGSADRQVRFVEINDIWKNPVARSGERGLHVTQANGAWPWFLGSFLGLGEFFSFLGDDDELLTHHVSTHVQAMRTANAMWSLSKIEFRAGGQFWNVIGDQSYAEAHLDATGIMCWKGALTVATWDPIAGIAAVDWKLVNDWRMAGLPGAFIDQVTGIHHDGWLSGMTGKPYEPVKE